MMKCKLTLEKIYEQETAPLNNSFNIQSPGVGKAYYALYKTIEEAFIHKIIAKSLEIVSKEPARLEEVKNEIEYLVVRFNNDFEPMNKGYL